MKIKNTRTQTRLQNKADNSCVEYNKNEAVSTVEDSGLDSKT